MEQIENRMLRERIINNDLSCNIRKLNGSGWNNFSDGTFVPEEDAFDYAIDHCTNFVPPGFRKIEWNQEFREMVVDWFYSSGEWSKEDVDGTD